MQATMQRAHPEGPLGRVVGGPQQQVEHGNALEERQEQRDAPRLVRPPYEGRRRKAGLPRGIHRGKSGIGPERRAVET